jgi:hypothetical protein
MVWRERVDKIVDVIRFPVAIRILFRVAITSGSDGLAPDITTNPGRARNAHLVPIQGWLTVSRSLYVHFVFENL